MYREDTHCWHSGQTSGARVDHVEALLKLSLAIGDSRHQVEPDSEDLLVIWAPRYQRSIDWYV